MLLEKGSTMLTIAQKSEIIRRLEIRKSFIQAWIISCVWYKETEVPITIFLWDKLKTWRAFWSKLERPKLRQLHKVLCKCLQQCVLKENSWQGLWWLKRTEVFFFGQMKITYWRSNQKLHVRTLVSTLSENLQCLIMLAPLVTWMPD